MDGELARDSEEITLELRESRRKRSTSQCSSQSAASWAAHFYIDTDEEIDEDMSERGFVNPVVLREHTTSTSSPRRESGIGSISPVPILPPPVTIKIQQSHRRSQTLPHSKPPRAPKHHQRSLSESKGDIKIYNNTSDVPRRNSLIEENNKKLLQQQQQTFFGPGNMLIKTNKETRIRKKGVMSNTSPVHLEMISQMKERDVEEGKVENGKTARQFLNVPDTQSTSGTSPVDKSRSNSCTDSGVSSCDDYNIGKPVIG